MVVCPSWLDRVRGPKIRPATRVCRRPVTKCESCRDMKVVGRIWADRTTSRYQLGHKVGTKRRLVRTLEDGKVGRSQNWYQRPPKVLTSWYYVIVGLPLPPQRNQPTLGKLNRGCAAPGGPPRHWESFIEFARSPSPGPPKPGAPNSSC